MVWCGKRSIAVGLVEDMAGQTELLVDLQGAFVEFDRLFDGPCVSISPVSIQLGQANSSLSPYCPDWKLMATGRNTAVDWRTSR